MQISFGSGNNSSFNQGGLPFRLLGGAQKVFGIYSMIIMLIIGVIFTGIGGLMVQEQIASRDWPTTTGTVISAETKHDRDSDGYETVTYTPVLEYTVNGALYQTEGGSSSTRPAIGSTISVAYEPQSPRHALVRSGADWAIYLFPIAGIALIIAAPIAYIRGRKKSASFLNDIASATAPIAPGVNPAPPTLPSTPVTPQTPAAPIAGPIPAPPVPVMPVAGPIPAPAAPAPSTPAPVDPSKTTPHV